MISDQWSKNQPTFNIQPRQPPLELWHRLLNGQHHSGSDLQCCRPVGKGGKSNEGNEPYEPYIFRENWINTASAVFLFLGLYVPRFFCFLDGFWPGLVEKETDQIA